MDLYCLGNRIRITRMNCGITQEKLAEMVDISTNFMSLIENGRNMSVETLVKIADALGVTVDYLLSDTMEVQSDKIMTQIAQNLSTLSDDEKLFFLNVIKQYKNIEK
ncbi:helix-turn-helix domain-containing protein [Ruminococcus sp.]|uniref:helix-turn-helix domain-containing protein n=1 Tax=Ruminococcus sp. TaxID=41978 RepID=UPI00261755ED|nr:helix-turn-helix transcriptional regulator [Ruminococcus sp.]MDD6989545.1 helix-turn-helix transcriptional regulator [Ruminococcus sp.]MDY6202398.1 helix-turn-helix transcriptional regulator [Ruminococcus sp.]